MNIRSSFIWQSLPIFSYIQFPWRFLMVTAFTSSLALAFLSKLPFKFLSRIIALTLVFLAIVLTFNYFQPEKKIQVDDEYYLKRFFADRTISDKREEVSPDYLNYSEDYLPLLTWTKKRPQTLPPKFEISDQARINFKEEKPTSFSFETESDGEQKVNFNSYFFPGWTVEIDGKKETPKIGDPYGQITFFVPPGKHAGKVYFSEVFFRRAFDLISGLGFLLAIVFLVLPVLKKHLPKRLMAQKSARRQEGTISQKKSPAPSDNLRFGK
jgi:energy-coupling factor transporter transmembrane protein EcfT